MITKEQLKEVETSINEVYFLEKNKSSVLVAVPLSKLIKTYKPSTLINWIDDIWSYDGKVGLCKLRDAGLTGTYAIMEVK